VYGLFSRKFARRERISQQQLHDLQSGYYNIPIGRKRVWFHVASLGEFRQAEPIISVLKESLPEIYICVTVFSPSGFENIGDKEDIDLLMYLPFDTRENANLFLESLRPDLAVFVRYEIWQNYLWIMKKMQIEKWLIASAPPNSKSSSTFFSNLYIQGLQLFDKIFPVNKLSRSYFNRIGIQTESAITDPRYDGIMRKMDSLGELNPDIYNIIRRYQKNRLLLTIGSGWKEDDQRIASPVSTKASEIFTIHVPHEPNPDYIDYLKSVYLNTYSLSELIDNTLVQEVDTLIIDKVGILIYLYAYSDFAYIGGGFGRGVHSVGEPLGAGLPMAAGSEKINTSPETDLLLQKDILQAIKGMKDMESWLDGMLNKSTRADIAQKSKNTFKSMTGASTIYAELIIDKLDTKKNNQND